MNPFANLSVVSSIGLLTLFALLIPIAIHLLSKTKGKLIKFADISLIGSTQQKPVAQLYLTQRKLLLLRLLLLLLLSLLLTQCVWQASSTNNSEQTTTLISPLWIKMASDEQKLSLASALNKPLEEQNVFLLTERFPLLSREQLLNPVFANSLQTSPTNIWMRTEQFSLANPQITNANIYVTNSLQQFIGSKITTAMPYKWHVLAQRQQDTTDLNTEIITPINVLMILDQGKQQAEPLSVRKWRHAMFIIQQALNTKLEIQEVSAAEYSQQNDIDWIIDFSQQHNISKLHSLNALVEYEDLPHFPLVLAEKILSVQQYKLDIHSLTVTEDQLTNTNTFEPIAQQLALNTPVFKNASTTESPFTKWLYIMLLVCFCLERIYSERINRQHSKVTNISFVDKEVN